MTDQPSIEQQLAEVIREASNVPFVGKRQVRLAAAIIAAVEAGTCPPIVPEGAAEYPWTLIDTAELAELRALKAKVDLLQRHPDDDAYVYRTDEWGWLVDSAGMLLTWLREASDD